jgi:hypothetical protein
MASHEPFGHLQPKLWAKEGPTTKSRESTFSRRLQIVCNMALEKGVLKCELTLLWLVLDADSSEIILVPLPSLIPRLLARPSTLF